MKNISGQFFVVFGLHPPKTPSGEKTQHIVIGQIFVFELLFQ
jgi:hypothetical protein